MYSSNIVTIRDTASCVPIRRSAVTTVRRMRGSSVSRNGSRTLPRSGIPNLPIALITARWT